MSDKRLIRLEVEFPGTQDQLDTMMNLMPGDNLTVNTEALTFRVVDWEKEKAREIEGLKLFKIEERS